MTELAFTSAYADDSGDKSSGTAVDKAFFEAIETAINALIHSTVYTGVTPKDIIDEVVAARGSLSDLDSRLDVVLNEDGTLKTQADLATKSEIGTVIGSRDLCRNNRFDRWTNGGSLAPDEWVLSGTGAAVARAGTGESDTTDLGTNHKVVKLTYGSALASLSQNIVTTTQFSERHQLRGVAGGPSDHNPYTVSASVRCYATISSHAQLVISDGVTQTAAEHSGVSVGGEEFEVLTVTHTLSSTADRVVVSLQVKAAGSAYFTLPSVVFGDIELANWIAEETIEDAGALLGGLVNLSDQQLGTGQKTIGDEVPIIVPGNSQSAARATVPGVKDDVDITSSGVAGGGAETTVHSRTIEADSLDANGKILRIVALLKTAANGNTKIVKVSFAGNEIIVINGAINDSAIWVEAYLVRLTSTTALFRAFGQYQGAATGVKSDLSGLDFTSDATLLFKIDGTSDDDVTIEASWVEFL